MNVKIQDPSLPDGYEIAITGLGTVLLNNQDVEVSDELVFEYETKTDKKFADLLKGKKFGGPGKPQPVEAKESTLFPTSDTNKVEAEGGVS